MSLWLYLDENVPRAIAVGLRQRGLDVLRIQDDGGISRDDGWILDRATELARAVFTMDSDFVREGRSRQRVGTHFCGVIYLSQKKLPVGPIIDRLEALCTASVEGDLDEVVHFL